MDSVHSWGSDEWSEDEWKKTVERGRRLWNDEHSADTGGGEGKKTANTNTVHLAWGGQTLKGQEGRKAEADGNGPRPKAIDAYLSTQKAHFDGFDG